MQKLKVLDTFAGIGGFSLGLEWTGGFETVGFVEFDESCQQHLKRRWPGVPVLSDIRTTTKETLANAGIHQVDVVTGGFPCQDISLNGRGAGITGERSGLWSHQCRLIGELRPRYAVMENVDELTRRGLDRVLGDLAEIRYDAQWACISAAEVGADHERSRIWIVAWPADTDNQSLRMEGLWPAGLEVAHALDQPLLPLRDRDGLWQIEPDLRRANDGLPRGMDRRIAHSRANQAAG